MTPKSLTVTPETIIVLTLLKLIKKRIRICFVVNYATCLLKIPNKIPDVLYVIAETLTKMSMTSDDI